MLEPLSRSQPSTIKDSVSPPADGNANLRRTKPLHVRNAKTRLLMGPRKINVAQTPGSVMERVRMIEGDLQAKRS